MKDNIRLHVHEFDFQRAKTIGLIEWKNGKEYAYTKPERVELREMVPCPHLFEFFGEEAKDVFQNLINDLWGLGYRPSFFETTVEELKAVVKDLKTIRENR